MISIKKKPFTVIDDLHVIAQHPSSDPSFGPAICKARPRAATDHQFVLLQLPGVFHAAPLLSRQNGC